MKKILLFLLFSSAASAQSLSTSSLPAAGNFVYIDQIGNSNNIYISQENNDTKKAMIVNNGDYNEFNIIQQGNGNHIAAISPTNTAPNSNNNNNNINILQQGNGNNTASILFADPVSNNSNTATIIQKGNAGADKQFTLTLQGSGIAASVTQDNLLIPDSGSMNIQCLTPPCSGYSYTRH
jgi:hypothetical protein